MLLTKIPDYIECKKIYIFNKKDYKFNHISIHSGNINRHSIFVIANNHKFNKDYAEEAIKKGAKAILTEIYIKNLRVNQYIVKDINLSLRILLNKLKPNKPLNTVAITGTNGKTSVAWYLSQICGLISLNCKTLGTIGYYINNIKKKESPLTTPNIDILHQLAFSKRINNYNFIFEASSHAIAQNRIKSFPINIAAITNITQDHLDFHKNYHSYRESKFKLFITYLDNNGFAILNDKITKINNLKKKINKNIKIVSFGLKNSDIYMQTEKKNTIIKIFKDKYVLNSTSFNNIELENISCALACCYCLNIDINHIIKFIKKLKNPPGRLEKVINKKGYKVYIDYAHTPDALKEILLSKTGNKIKPNLVFGCGGNRDKSKRSKMGRIANKYSNKVYITDDNPRYENPEKIRKNILDYCKKGIVIPGRKLAITQAIKDLTKNEVLIIAGKGHENFQIIKNIKKKFNDLDIAKLVLKNL